MRRLRGKTKLILFRKGTFARSGTAAVIAAAPACIPGTGLAGVATAQPMRRAMVGTSANVIASR